MAGAVFWPVTEDDALTQALNSIKQGPWNVSGPFSNETGLSRPSSNATGHNISNHPNTTLEGALWPYLDTYNNFPDQCLLWDKQCIGDRAEALELFFNNSGTLYNVVYGAHCIWSREVQCAPWLPSPAVLRKLLKWLRQPDCVQSFYDYHTQHADESLWTWSHRTFDGWSTLTIDWNTMATTRSNVGCCGQCEILGGNADVYYWPVPGANSDCVSIIGSSFNDPARELLVTDNRGYPYWKAQTNPWGRSSSQYVDGITIPPEQALAGGAANPLSAANYIVQAREYRQANNTLAANISISEAIATIGSFRCTSPSVCVGFSNLYAADGCGALSTDGELIPYTVVAFAPGELSTIQTPAWVRAQDPPKAAIRSFNFADLPCPPQSVMYAAEYKPAPGEPYRPVLSAPSRLSSLLPEWSRSNCIIPAALFNGVDPPRFLRPAEILTPRITQALSSASVAATAAPVSGVQASGPRKTLDPSRNGDDDTPDLSDPETRESGSELSDPSGSGSHLADPKNINPKASGSKDSEIIRPSPNRAHPQDIRPATTDLGKTAAGASGPKPRPEIFDPKSATVQPSDPQDVEPQALDKYDKPKTAQGFSYEASSPDDPKADSPKTNRFKPNCPTDSSSNAADSSIQKAKDLPPHGCYPHPPNSDTKDISSSEPLDAEAASYTTETPHPLNHQAMSKAKEASSSHPNKSPTAGPKANGDDQSEDMDKDEDIDPFHVLHTKLFNLNEALSPSAKAGDGRHSTPNDPEPDWSSGPNIMEDPQPDPDLSDESKTLKEEVLTVHYTGEALPTKTLNAMADVPSMIASTEGSTLSPQHQTTHLPSADSDGMEGSPSNIATADASASLTVAVNISETSGSILPAASTAATSRRLGGGELSSQGSNDSINTKSSGTVTLLASKRPGRSNILTRTQDLLYWLCIYSLPWLLISL